VLSTEVKGKKEAMPCRLMAENDNSWSQEDNSWRKATRYVEVVRRRARFIAQSSVLSTQYLS
jgi:hypothetical protein